MAKSVKAKPAAAAKAEAKDAGKQVSNALASYRSAKSIQANVKKTVTQEALGTEVKSEGIFYFSKGKLRMEIKDPERSTLVYDGRNVWFETPLDEKRVHVTRMRVNELKRSDSLLTALFEKRDILKSFKFLKVNSKSGQKNYVFEPRDKKKSEVQRLEIALRAKEIERISYQDQVENRVTLEFSNVDRRGKVSQNKFAYKPPAKAEVTEL